MNPAAPSPEMFGAPVATWALMISLLSFAIAIVALVWQVTKHFLDGGRVKVYLNTAVWEPEFMLATNRSGRFALKNDNVARSALHGRALELAQLVVENPGRVPVTIYSPGLSISGGGKKDHSLVPRMFGTEDSFGPDRAVTDTVVRIEPYGRVTFLLDYWSVMPGLLREAPKGRVFMRGFVGVAGRTKRPQKSSWRRRWRINEGAYTAIEGSPDFTPFSVLWREMYIRLPKRADDDPGRHPDAGKPITRGLLTYILDEAMSRFDERPEREELKCALDELAKKHGDRFPMLGYNVFEAYEALDRMEGHLVDWAAGRSQRKGEHVSVIPSAEAGKMERSVVALPEQEYLARIGEVAYTVSSIEWTILGDLYRLADCVPEGLALERLEPMMTSGIAGEVKKASKEMEDGPTKDYLVEVYRALYCAAEIRSDVLHSRPATHPEGQRLYRAETKDRKTTGKRFWIDEDWFDASIAKLNKATAGVMRVRPPLE